LDRIDKTIGIPGQTHAIKLTRRMLLVVQELLTFSEHLTPLVLVRFVLLLGFQLVFC